MGDKLEDKKSEQSNEEGHPVQRDDDVNQKKKSDDLWASFLSDVGTRPKQSTAVSNSETIPKVICSNLVC